jgi:plasmid stability protein
MTDVRVRDLDDDIVSLLKEQARGNQRTLENYIREVLTDLATRPRRELAERAARLRASIREESGALNDSSPFIREERDRRG